MKKLKKAYCVQKSKAKHRGIAFLMTFEEWLAIWQASGRLHERGCRRGQYVMARHGDRGPYTTSNVKIVCQHENHREGLLGNKHLLGHRHGTETRRKISKTGTGRPPTQGFSGRHHSPETRLKISQAKRAASAQAGAFA